MYLKFSFFQKKTFSLLLLSILYTTVITAQIGGNKSLNNPWVVGIGLNAIDDSGSALSNAFKFNKSYFFTKPYKLFVEKRFKNNFGVEASFSMNTFDKGKVYSNSILTEPINFLASDLSLKYYITNLFLDKYRSYFEGFILGGIGRSLYDWDGVSTVNAGAGFTVYITKQIRLLGQSSAKIPTVYNIERTKYLQYDIGIVYRLP